MMLKRESKRNKNSRRYASLLTCPVCVGNRLSQQRREDESKRWRYERGMLKVKRRAVSRMRDTDWRHWFDASPHDIDAHDRCLPHWLKRNLFESPQRCSQRCCGNQRQWLGPKASELRMRMKSELDWGLSDEDEFYCSCASCRFPTYYDDESHWILDKYLEQIRPTNYNFNLEIKLA